MKLSVGFAITAAFFWLLGFVFAEYNVGPESFSLSQLCNEIVGGSLFGLILIVFYYLLGEETSVKLLRDLRKISILQQAAIVLGISDVTQRRRDLRPEAIEAELSTSSKLFFASPEFKAIIRGNTQGFFNRFVKKNGEGGVRLLVQADSPAIEDIIEFRKSLNKEERKKFNFRILSNPIPFSIYGGDGVVYVTMRLINKSGDDCPVIVCRTTGQPNSLFESYRLQFEELWQHAIDKQ